MAGTVVGSASIEISPDVANFGAKTEAAVRRALAGVRANIELTLDDNGLRNRVHAAVRAATAGLEANIEANLDTDALKGRVGAALEEVAREAALGGGEQLDLFDIDPAQLAVEVAAAKEAARAALAAGQQLELDLDFSAERAFAEIRPALEAAIAAAEQAAEIEVPVTADDSDLTGQVRRAVRAAEAGSGGIDVPIRADGADRAGDAVGGIFGRAVLRTAARVLAAGALAQMFTAATSGAVALGGALIAATGSAGSLVATVAALPGILSAAAQAAATVGLALGGIGGALKAYTAAQKAAGVAAVGGGGGGGGGQSASAARAAERAIRNASRGVEDAQRAAADAVEAAEERIQESGRSLIRAQRDQIEAQADLTRARVEAREEADELRRSVERLSLTEAEARRRLAEARIRNALAEQRAQLDLTGASEETIRALERQAAIEDRAAVNPREKAANDLRDAELDLEEAIAKRTSAEAELAEFERTGVEGTERVIDARQRLADADERVADEERDFARAHRDLVRAREDGARRIQEAEERLADAIAAAAEGAAGAAGAAAGAANRYQAALEALSPAARRFVEFLVSLEPLLKRVQATAAAGLFPGLEQAIRTVLPLIDDLEPIVFDTARALAVLSIEAANLVASPAFRADLVTQGRRNIEIIQGFGLAAIASADAMRHIVIAAGPMTRHIVALTLHYAELIRAQAEIGRDSGRMEAFFGRVSDRLDRMLVAAGFLGRGLFNVFREATPAGDAYFDTLTRLSARFDLLVERARESGALRRFFADSRPAVEEVSRLVRDLVVGLVDIGRANLGAFTAFTNQLRTDLLPALLEVLGTIDTDFLSAIVSLMSALTRLFGAILAGNPALTLFVQILGGMADGISTLLQDIPILSPIIQAVVTAFGALGVAIASITLTRLASETFGAARAIGFLTGATSASAAASTAAGAGAGAAAAGIGAAGAAAGAATPAVSRLAVALNALNKLMVGIAVAFGIREAIDSIAPSVDKATAAVIRAKDPVAAFDAQMRKLEGGGSVVERVATNIRNIFNEGIPGAMGKADGAVAKTIDAFRDLANEAPAAAQAVVDGWRAQGRDTAAYDKILREVIDSKAAQGIAEEEVQRKVQDATAALKGANAELDRHISKLRDATNQALSLSGAEIATEEAIDRLSESLRENGVTFDTNSEAGRRNKRALDDLVGSIQREIQELSAAAAAGQLDNARKERLIQHLDNLARSGYPGAAQAAANLRSQLDAVQNTYTAYINIDASRALDSLRVLQMRINSVDFSNIEGRTTPGIQREFGGRVERNRAYIVGEKRPELFIPDENGVILPTVPDVAMPKSVTDQLDSFRFLPGADFDVDGLTSAVRDLEETLTDALATDALPPGGTEPERADRPKGVSVVQNFNAALIDMDATFGPGSSAADIIEAMRAIARNEITGALAEVLRDHGAGVGTRGPT